MPPSPISTCERAIPLRVDDIVMNKRLSACLVNHVSKREIKCFRSLREFVNVNDSEMFKDDVFQELAQYLTSIRANFEKYFPEEQNTKMKLNS